MRIDQFNVDNVLRCLNDGDSLDHVQPTFMDLGSALEIGIWAICQSNRIGHPSLIEWKENHLYLREVIDLFSGSGQPCKPSLFEALPHEFFRIQSANDFKRDEWGLFLGRFASSLLQSGFGKLSHAISGALQEIALNIAEHSSLDAEQPSVDGLIAYTVSKDEVTFAVGDFGIGALTSLKTNPKWATLINCRDAVHAIAKKGASRRKGHGDGQGYRQLLVAITSFNGTLRLRSGDGLFSMVGSLGSCRPVGANVPFIPGLQLSITCKKK